MSSFSRWCVDEVQSTLPCLPTVPLIPKLKSEEKARTVCQKSPCQLPGSCGSGIRYSVVKQISIDTVKSSNLVPAAPNRIRKIQILTRRDDKTNLKPCLLVDSSSRQLNTSVDPILNTSLPKPIKIVSTNMISSTAKPIVQNIITSTTRIRSQKSNLELDEGPQLLPKLCKAQIIPQSANLKLPPTYLVKLPKNQVETTRQSASTKCLTSTVTAIGTQKKIVKDTFSNSSVHRLVKTSSLEDEETEVEEFRSPATRWPTSQPRSYRGAKRDLNTSNRRAVRRPGVVSDVTTDGETSGMGSSLDEQVESSTESASESSFRRTTLLPSDASEPVSGICSKGSKVSNEGVFTSTFQLPSTPLPRVSSEVSSVFPVSSGTNLQPKFPVLKRRGGWPKGRKRKPEVTGGIKAPKAPMTAYVFYITERRNHFRDNKPDNCHGPGDVTKLIGREWTNLSKEERVPYVLMSEQDKKRYKSEMHQYRQRIYLRSVSKKKRLRNALIGGNPEDSSDYTDGPEDEYPEELYCTKCDKFFSSLHNKRMHLHGRNHNRVIPTRTVADTASDTATDYNTDYTTDYEDSSRGCYPPLSSSTTSPCSSPLPPSFSSPNTSVPATSASEDEDLLPEGGLKKERRERNLRYGGDVSGDAIVEEGNEGDMEDGGEDEDSATNVEKIRKQINVKERQRVNLLMHLEKLESNQEQLQLKLQEEMSKMKRSPYDNKLQTQWIDKLPEVETNAPQRLEYVQPTYVTEASTSDYNQLSTAQDVRIEVELLNSSREGRKRTWHGLGVGTKERHGNTSHGYTFSDHQDIRKNKKPDLGLSSYSFFPKETYSENCTKYPQKISDPGNDPKLVNLASNTIQESSNEVLPENDNFFANKDLCFKFTNSDSGMSSDGVTWNLGTNVTPSTTFDPKHVRKKPMNQSSAANRNKDFNWVRTNRRETDFNIDSDSSTDFLPRSSNYVTDYASTDTEDYHTDSRSSVSNASSGVSTSLLAPGVIDMSLYDQSFGNNCNELLFDLNDLLNINSIPEQIESPEPPDNQILTPLIIEPPSTSPMDSSTGDITPIVLSPSRLLSLDYSLDDFSSLQSLLDGGTADVDLLDDITDNDLDIL